MNAYLLICNPVDVWDFRAFFASNPAEGYWCVTKTNFESAEPGDRLYLRVTSRDSEPGIHGRFTLKSKYKGTVPSKHWRAGRAPADVAEQFIFDVHSPALLKPHLSVTILRAAFDASSRLIRVPQTLSTEISNDEADEIDRLIGERI